MARAVRGNQDPEHVSDPLPPGDEAQGPERGALELTVKGLVVGLVLALLLGPANMYVGMRVGLTVSASIPAAVLSLAILRSFRKRSIQENNIAQTIASSAEALAAGVIFTIPALLPAFLGIWDEVHIGDTILIAMVGGLLGVLFAVPLRKALIVDRKLPYPEGVACAAVLRAGHGGAGARLLVAGAIAGGVFAFAQLGLALFPTTAEMAGRLGDTILFAGTDLSLILIGVGFIVGLRIATLIFSGGVFAWFVVLPLLSTFSGVELFDVPSTAGMSAVDAAFEIWDAKIRLIGAGAMFTGGVLAIWQLRSSLATAAREGLQGYKEGPGTGDMPMRYVVIGVLLLVLPLTYLVTDTLPGLWQALVTVVVVVIAGFLLSAVAGYMAGVVGSSNNPVSGVTILALAAAAAMLSLFGISGSAGILGALIVAALIATGAAISGDTMQDLKTGHMVRATPWKQQLGQVLGVAVFAMIAPFVLVLLDQAFTIGSGVLPAPQAGLMAAFLDAFFGTGVDVNMLGFGALTGAVVAGFGLPVLPVAVGVYLPLGLTAPIFIGGVMRWAVARAAQRRGADPEAVDQRGTLMASGVIAGEAVAGIVLAGLIVQDAQSGTELTFTLAPLVLGVLVAIGVKVVLGRAPAATPLALGWGLAGLVITLLIGLDATLGEAHAAAVVAPVVMGLMVGAALPVVRGRRAWPAGVAVTGAGLALALLLWNGTLSPSLSAGPLAGLIIMAYGTLVMGFLALRPQLVQGGG